MKRALLALAAVSVLAMALPAFGAAKADPRIKAVLDKLKLTYEIDKDNDFSLPYDLGDGRSQTVFLMSKTTKIGELEFREVASIGAMFEGDLPAGLAEKLLLQSRDSTIGSWQMEKDGNNKVLVFVAKLPLDAEPKSWVKVIEGVAGKADLLEREVSKEDRF